jgi:CxxC motif-containing protein (DUF1111 family)
MESMGCKASHVPTWSIAARDTVHAGDRRFFDLNVGWSESTGELQGSLARLYDVVGQDAVRRFNAVDVHGLFTDFEHHDLGAGFKEIDFGGTVNTVWRTSPLWGVGRGFPWGHDGRSSTITDAILRHDGERAASKAAWISASPADRAAESNLLNKAQLYDIETVDVDVDQDGVVADHLFVAGMDTGRERFNPE